MFKLIKIQLEIFASLQTLFPFLKIVIFCRIVPLLSPHAPPLTMRRPRGEYEMKAPGKNCTLQTLFLTLKIAIFWRIAPLLSPDVPH